MSQRKKMVGKVHYLKEVSPAVKKRTQGIEKLIQDLGRRIGGVEKESGAQERFRRDLESLKQELNNQIREISSALEQKIKLKTGDDPKHASLIQRLWGMLPAAPHWLAPPDSKKEFEKLWSEEIDPFGRDPEFELRLKPFFDFLYYKYWRISTHGLEHIPSKGRALLVSNHSGTLPYDGSMIRIAVTNDHPAQRDVRFLVEDFVYYLPFIGTYMYRLGGVRASQENAERLLNSDHLVAVFPEGVKGIGKYYSERYHLQRFGRGGFIKLAIRTRSPLIPVAVIGAEEIHPILYKSSLLAKPLGIPYIPVTPTLPILGPFGFLPFPSKWSIYFGEPIDFSEYPMETLKDELKIHRLSEMVRQKIQAMVTEGLKNRRSVWFG
jgi:1-acyl-sn-glycerol-3-phosphate acyltransferase